MKLNLFHYHLPTSRIAQSPVSPRDHSRLMVLDKKTGQLRHDNFYNLPRYLQAGDVLVFNDTKVFPARLIGRKLTGGVVEVFLLRPVRGKTWEALVGGKIRRVGLELKFGHGLRGTIIQEPRQGVWRVTFNKDAAAVQRLTWKIGQTPTPPYIKASAALSKYQTVYAKHIGSVAAPTAGFHFTKRLLKNLDAMGVQREFVTLHVGYGTFAPVKEANITQHQMHEEYASVSAATMKRLVKAKAEGRRIICVGTTTVRVLESVFHHAQGSREPSLSALKGAKGFSGWTNIFIYPGYQFKMVDAMITNFHLSESTLLMLVSAFATAPADRSALAGVKKVMRAYNTAVKKKYRFYSFGDGMLIS